MADYSGAEKAICFILVLIIYGAAAFAYVLCIFGPYETSIRMRLIRELGGSTGQTPLPDVLRRYNTAIILENRLTRLVGSQDLAKKGDTYHLRKTGNVFFIMDTVAQKMHAFIHAR